MQRDLTAKINCGRQIIITTVKRRLKYWLIDALSIFSATKYLGIKREFKIVHSKTEFSTKSYDIKNYLRKGFHEFERK